MPENEESAFVFPVHQPKSPYRAKAVDTSLGGLTIEKPGKELGRYAEVTASAMIKFEAMANRHRYPKSVQETRSPSPLRRRSNSPLPGASGVGWGFLTDKQRPNLSVDWLRGNNQKPFYDWAKSFEAASTFPRSPSSCWGREASLRSQPEQWIKDKKRCDGARVDGRRPTLSPAVRRSASARSEAAEPSRSASPDRRSHHTSVFSASVRDASPQHEASLHRTVPKPIPLGKDRAEDQWRTHWQHQLGGSAGYTISHPDWTKRGGRSFGKSKRIVIEPMPSGGTAGLSARRSRSPSPQAGRSLSPRPVKV